MNPIKTPEKRYPISADLRVELTPSVRGKEGIYEISNGENRYVGQSCNVARRALQHACDARHPARDKGRTKLAKALREDPQSYTFAVYPRDENMSLPEQEDFLIRRKAPSLNTRRGGGGGAGRKRAEPSDVDPLQTTPQKKYPVVEENGKIRVKLTPNVKRLRDVTYVFENTLTGDRLVGQTAQSVAARIGPYNHAFNHPETDKGKMPLPNAVRENPGSFVFGVYPEATGTDESKFIAAKQSTYNQNKGGGGSSVSKFY